MKKLQNFSARHIGPSAIDTTSMLNDVGVNSFDELINKTIPNGIKLEKEFQLGEPVTEYRFLNELKKIAVKNKVFNSYIGLGYYNTITPSVIQRNILENPGWYTQYTPYQAEISQGRLEALLNFQTVISDLTALPLANASLLDEGTAAAEAMSMLYAARKKDKKNSNVFFVSDKCFPQTIDVIKTRSEPLGVRLKIGSIQELELTDEIFGVLVQYPDKDGKVNEFSELFDKARQKNIFTCAAADLMSLALLVPPGEFGADVALGSTQRFGVPVGFGGPHAAYFAAKEEFKRLIPGRIIGISIDAQGKTAYRMALQTREQHIKRERATSNICTAQVLLAIMAGMYAVYHGPDGIKKIASKIHKLTQLLDHEINKAGFTQENNIYFDTLNIKVDDNEKGAIKKIAEGLSINFGYFYDGFINISIGETEEIEDIVNIINVFRGARHLKAIKIIDESEIEEDQYPISVLRKSKFLTGKVFNSYHSETELMRYMKSLENKDLSLTTSMIPLGSCTMKLNAASEMFSLTWQELSLIHPFAPSNQTEGYKIILNKLGEQIKVITGFPAVTFQPNSGAQGEFTGLMVIRAYHRKNGSTNRNVVLIPSSAHGTNPASAVMAGSKVVIVNCDSKGNIDIVDLKKKAFENKENLSALMVTYPSTHGVFEEEIVEICEVIHENGGLVYMDGANLNAQVGLTNPAIIGADVCHLNLHKTFAIPHGGGGPGAGPIAVTAKLAEFLPGHSVINIGSENSISAVSSAPYGSASILLISFAYIKLMGSAGLVDATKYAILNANYIKSKLEPYYPVLYTGANGFVGHELIFDCREFKNSAGVEVDDIAKRLMDYGYHAPTVSFPVHGTLMVEPTESESKVELDKFCEAMISIRNEISEIENNKYDRVDNVLKNSPHTAAVLLADKWEHKYTREKAAFPYRYAKENKFWPAVSRIDNAYGDRNLVCSCLPLEYYNEN